VHGVTFADTRADFGDPQCVLAEDLAHSANEQRYFCFGRFDGGVLTDRFTLRGSVIRILGARYWRKGRETYEFENQLHKRPDPKDQGPC